MTIDARPGVVPAGVDEVAGWDDAHRYTPAPRHRRRLLLRALDRLDFDDVLDAGCAQPYLLGEVARRYGVSGAGCDLSATVVEGNRRALPSCEFRALDLTREVWPGGRTFDLVVCSEVLEHIEAWPEALANVVRMARKHVVLTVPSGPLRAMDRRVGHVQHFDGHDLARELGALGCRVDRVVRWGWPLHSAYKAAISAASPERLYASFSGVRYGFAQKAVSELLYRLFFLNDLTGWGNQLLIVAGATGAPAREGGRRSTRAGRASRAPIAGAS